MNSTNNLVPRTKSSRQRPNSGYRVRKPPESNNSAQMSSHHGGMNERQNSPVDSPKSSRSSADSGVYTGFHDGQSHNQMNYSHQHYARPHSNTRPSRRPASRCGARDIELDYDRPSMVTPSSSRPSSSCSFSRYAILPNIGQSTSNTPEPFSHPLSNFEPSNSDTNVEPVEGNNKIHHHAKTQRIANTKDNNFETELANMKLSSTNKEKIDKQKTKTQSSTQSDTAVIFIPTENNTTLVTSDKDHRSASDSTDDDPIQSMFPPLKRKVVLPPEPSDKEKSILLAVKLPNGQRVQRHFKQTDSILNILRFSEYSSNLDFSSCFLVCDAPPKQIFRDHNVKICDTKLENRTVLHIQIPDD